MLKTLQKHLKDNENSLNVAEILDLVSQVKTQAMINQGFKILSHKLKSAGTFKEVIEQYLQTYCDDGMGIPVKYPSRILKIRQNLRQN